jgi:hypothetical protein
MARKLGILAVLSGLSALSLAQSPASGAASATTIVTVYLFDTDPQPILASVITANPTATTYHIECPTYTDCGWIPGANLTVSDNSIFEVSLTDTEFTMSVQCTVNSDAVCQESFAGSSANFPGSSVETIPSSSITSIPITVTAGLDKLSSATAVASSSGKSSSSSAKQTSAAGNATSTPNAAGKDITTWMPLALVSFAALLVGL